jgi:hypothetical protein
MKTQRLLLSGLCLAMLGLVWLCSPVFASDAEDVAADTVATAFQNARAALNLPKLERMGRNRLRTQACENDRRFGSGNVDVLFYQTPNPAQLPETSQQIVSGRGGSGTPFRFAVGVCVLKSAPGSPTTYSIVIATYMNRWDSFWSYFWD